MDPNETLGWMTEALADGMDDEAAEYGECLRDWLRRGGFEPEWERYPEASRFFASRFQPLCSRQVF